MTFSTGSSQFVSFLFYTNESERSKKMWRKRFLTVINTMWQQITSWSYLYRRLTTSIERNFLKNSKMFLCLNKCHRRLLVLPSAILITKKVLLISENSWHSLNCSKWLLIESPSHTFSFNVITLMNYPVLSDVHRSSSSKFHIKWPFEFFASLMMHRNTILADIHPPKNTSASWIYHINKLIRSRMSFLFILNA